MFEGWSTVPLLCAWSKGMCGAGMYAGTCVYGYVGGRGEHAWAVAASLLLVIPGNSACAVHRSLRVAVP